MDGDFLSGTLVRTIRYGLFLSEIMARTIRWGCDNRIFRICIESCRKVELFFEREVKLQTLYEVTKQKDAGKDEI